MYIDYGLVVLVVVVGRDELQFRGEIALSDHLNALDFLRAVFLVFPLVVPGVAAALSLASRTKVALG